MDNNMNNQSVRQRHPPVSQSEASTDDTTNEEPNCCSIPGDRIDIASRVIFPIVFILFTIGYAIYYHTKTNY